MGKAYLTIDDGPTKNTKSIIDFLKSKRIIPIMFFYGLQIEKSRDEGIYAIKNGAIIGNHSYTHPHFSEISMDECVAEIEEQEKLIQSLHEEAGARRESKLFRFPYGDKGGKNHDFLQKYLAKNNFSKIRDNSIRLEWYHENEFDKERDIFWTFDFSEYNMTSDLLYTYEDIMKRIHDKTGSGRTLFDTDGFNIVIIHDHEKTEEIFPGYFSKLIDHVLDNGLQFVKPVFFNPQESA